MKARALIAIWLLSGCAQQGHLSGFEASDALIDRCTHSVETIAERHATRIETLADIQAMSKSISAEQGQLATMLSIPAATGGLRQPGRYAADRMDVIIRLRENAVRVLHDEACGSTVDEYLTDELFGPGRWTVPDGLSAAYLPFQNAGVSPSTFLLLLLLADFNTNALPGSIGSASMMDDGTIVLTLRAESDEAPGLVGDALLEYPPGHPRYKEVLDHLGGLRPGENKPVPPWP